MSAQLDKPATLADLEAFIGRKYHFVGVDEVSRNDIRRKLEAFCFDCPLHYDTAVARKHGYRDVVAPTVMTALWAMPAYWNPGDPVAFVPGARENPGGMRAEIPLPALHPRGVNAGSEWEFFEPIYPGDRLEGDLVLKEVKPRETKLGPGVFLIYETEVYKTTGELVGKNRNSNLRYTPKAKEEGGEGKRKSVEKPAEPPAEVSDKEVTSSAPPDWSRQLHWGDVKVGDEVPHFSMWLSYQRIVMSVAVDRMFSGIHHNRERAREGGLKDIIFNTRSYEMLFEAMLRRWIGLDGRVRKMGPFRMGGSTYPDDIVTAKAKVTAKPEPGRVTVEVVALNNRGEAARGEAQVDLPA
jgi:3-methylfumaryl-CoA hydratase